MFWTIHDSTMIIKLTSDWNRKAWQSVSFVTTGAHAGPTATITSGAVLNFAASYASSTTKPTWCSIRTIYRNYQVGLICYKSTNRTCFNQYETKSQKNHQSRIHFDRQFNGKCASLLYLCQDMRWFMHRDVCGKRMLNKEEECVTWKGF